MSSDMGASRRAVVRGIAGTIGAAVLAPAAIAQQPTAALGTPLSVITNPPRQWGRDAPPNIYPDPDVVVIDPAFAALRVGNVPIRRVATGFAWAEGRPGRARASITCSVTWSGTRNIASCGMIFG